jgi:hypothetical protein
LEGGDTLDEFSREFPSVRLDFALAVLGLRLMVLGELAKIMKRKVEASRPLEEIAFSKPNALARYTDVALERLS